jgi:hypothetical protein
MNEGVKILRELESEIRFLKSRVYGRCHELEFKKEFNRIEEIMSAFTTYFNQLESAQTGKVALPAGGAVLDAGDVATFTQAAAANGVTVPPPDPTTGIFPATATPATPAAPATGS